MARHAATCLHCKLLQVDGTFESSSTDAPGELEASNLSGTDERDGEQKVELTFHRAVLAPRTDKGARQWTEDESRHGPVKDAIKQVRLLAVLHSAAHSAWPACW